MRMQGGFGSVAKMYCMACIYDPLISFIFWSAFGLMDPFARWALLAPGMLLQAVVDS